MRNGLKVETYAWQIHFKALKAQLCRMGKSSCLFSNPLLFFAVYFTQEHKHTYTHTVAWQKYSKQISPIFTASWSLSSSVETQRRQTLDPFMYQMLGAQASSTAGLLCVMRKSPTLSVYMNVQMIWGIICIQRGREEHLPSKPPCSEQKLFRWFVKKKQPAWGYRCNCYQ